MKTVCQVCMHHCAPELGQTGLCRARKNEGGEIVCANYGQITSLALDPIEKKPLYDFHPGSMILSVGSFGCNLRCPFCQNYEISMTNGSGLDAEQVSPGSWRIWRLCGRKKKGGKYRYRLHLQRAFGGLGVCPRYGAVGAGIRHGECSRDERDSFARGA